ncbi:MAG: UDP-N-acetylglucosamine 2-epimerase (non-hydrolyzing) [Candidatus Hydrogenedentes bacterium]|nr:UDP-N-acetylglucosamine 2-epimerase (non-hydrolyzing) [Candidatus Hydrogenedentota bacterium]
MTRPLQATLVMGTRPEVIKLAPLYLRLRREPERFSPQFWTTGQHRELLDQALATFALTPDRDFQVMRPGQTPSDVAAAVLGRFQETFARERPDVLIVQGDTTTAFAASLAAFYAGVRVAHVEAGLRTWNRFAPWPEEANRQMISCLADFHFAPTSRARDNLLAQGIEENRVWVTGNTVIDALDLVVARVRACAPTLPPDFPAARLADDRLMVLITGHRRENFGGGFEAICRAVARLAERFPRCEFVYPVHLNPNVREPVARLLSGRENVHLIEPLAYEPFVWAMDRASLLLTDSGGVQEEAPHLGKPVLVMRDTTERPEAVEAGTALLVGADEERIVAACARLLEDPQARAEMAHAVNPYGDGHASERIAEILGNAEFGTRKEEEITTKEHKKNKKRR